MTFLDFSVASTGKSRAVVLTMKSAIAAVAPMLWLQKMNVSAQRASRDALRTCGASLPDIDGDARPQLIAPVHLLDLRRGLGGDLVEFDHALRHLRQRVLAEGGDVVHRDLDVRERLF